VILPPLVFPGQAVRTINQSILYDVYGLGIRSKKDYVKSCLDKFVEMCDSQNIEISLPIHKLRL
jgi:hypothetical protein